MLTQMPSRQELSNEPPAQGWFGPHCAPTQILEPRTEPQTKPPVQSALVVQPATQIPPTQTSGATHCAVLVQTTPTVGGKPQTPSMQLCPPVQLAELVQVAVHPPLRQTCPLAHCPLP